MTDIQVGDMVEEKTLPGAVYVVADIVDEPDRFLRFSIRQGGRRWYYTLVRLYRHDDGTVEDIRRNLHGAEFHARFKRAI